MCKKYAPDAKLLCSDLININLPDQIFDAVWISHTLEHCNEPSKSLKEINRLLKPNGSIYIIVPYPSDMHRIHCGSSELKLNILDDAKSTLEFLKTEGYTILDSKLMNIKEPELFLKIK